MKEQATFKPLARLILQLGDQLIKNEKIALLELVKNAYDADATHIDITMRHIDEPDKGVIVIEDNGIGMDLDIVRNVWMKPGSDYKEKLYKEREIAANLKSRFNRIPLGEKGIGRFSVHKLGNNIELVTRKKGQKEIAITIDWHWFKKPKYLEEVPIEIIEREPEIFKRPQTGTRITVKDLKVLWSRGDIREIYRSVTSLCSPFESPDSFTINFKIDKKKWLENLLSWQEVEDYSLYRFDCEMEGEYIKKFTYRFTPWPTMAKLKTRKLTEKDPEINKVKKMADIDNSAIDLSRYKIGKVKFEALIFDRSPKILSLGVQDKKGLKDYLNENGGIRVYRDGVRVYDYGERDNDWLNLDIRRVNIPGKRLSNNIVLGAVHLKREDSEDLIEKTNREGFVENEAYDTFVGAVLYVLDKVETFRKIDKDKLRVFYGPTPVSEPVISNLSELQELIDKKINDKSLKQEVTMYLKRIEQDYKDINEILLRSAGAGLSLSVVIHEMQKIIDELKKVIEKEPPTKRIVSLVKHLAQLVEGYSLVIRKAGRKSEDLTKLLDQAIFNVEFRLQAHNIQVIKGYDGYKKLSNVNCARNLVIGSILNIIDNSIWWLDYGEVQNKKIYFSISDEMEGYTTILIADNGPGFSLPTEEITKPFVSAKPDGMGLGLHIANEIMEGHKGMLLFPEEDEFTIPKAFQKGAIVALAFRAQE
ncbi:MAG: ATP-binding protein [Nitrospirota bacterium]